MHHRFSPQFSNSPLSTTANGAIEWEELPSLAESLNQRLVVLGTRHRDAVSAAQARAQAFRSAARFGRAWDSTLPAELEPARPTQPFTEAFKGLAMREVSEPDVFRHFFDPTTF